ncbi:hypothetical protein FJT64_021954 [Amphibalanus amphitrite]|uniref:Gustatory receptor n=1 Tax=Amphibalanus amphitrite TaxID=1232801 RepID=A0A6A4WWT4_AMPAM|nr:hypothetical protein FJT64_021954 [Amphibalanus amphitrite]
MQPAAHVEVRSISTELEDVSTDPGDTSPDLTSASTELRDVSAFLGNASSDPGGAALKNERTSTELAPMVIWPSTADRALVALLRVAGQTGGPGWPARLYAALLYITVAAVSVMSVIYFLDIGFSYLRKGMTLLEAAFATFFFGCVQGLPLVPLTATVICGRRRYAALLPEVQQLAEELAQKMPNQPVRRWLRKKAALLLGATVVAFTMLTFLMLIIEVDGNCWTLSFECLTRISLFLIVSITMVALLSIPIKFRYVTLVVGVGFGAVDTELRSLARDGDLKDWNRLAQLRLLHDRLSGAFSRLVTDMTPELILSMMTGVISLVISFLLGFQSTVTGDLKSNYHSMLYTLLTAVLQIAVPCEAGQHVLDLAAATRCSLLKLRWEAARVGQEVSALQEAVRRDLDHLGDLGYYRLQRSTMVAIMSTIVTYIVIFVQFRMS